MEEGEDKLQKEIETEILKIRKIIAEREEKRMNNNRRGRIYALNYLINRQLGKEKGKMTVIFIDLKAAFDLVDKENANQDNESKRSEGGISRQEWRSETKSRVKVGRRSGGIFWMAKGVRQDLSSILFNLLIADMGNI